VRLAEAWRTRAGEVGGDLIGDAWTGDERFALVVARGPHRIRIDFPYAVEWASRQSVRTRVWCARAEPGAPVAALWQPDLARAARPKLAKLDADDGSLSTLGGPLARRDAPELVEQRAMAANVDWIVIDETTIAAGWDAIVESTTALGQGADLVAALADWLAPRTPTDGPYR
jgi:hypothetical protein